MVLIPSMFLQLIRSFLSFFFTIGNALWCSYTLLCRCSWMYQFYLFKWNVVCGRMGAELFYFQMEHAPVGTDKLFWSYEFVFWVILLVQTIPIMGTSFILPFLFWLSPFSMISLGYRYLRELSIYSYMLSVWVHLTISPVYPSVIWLWMCLSLFDCLRSLSCSDIDMQIYIKFLLKNRNIKYWWNLL